jgi:hypothetical protein
MTQPQTLRRGEGPLASRKKLLIAESELNRVQLFRELEKLADESRALANRAGNIGSIASAGATLIAGLASFRRKKPAPAAEKPSWLQTLLKSAGLVSTILTAFRPPHQDLDGN